MSGNSGQMDKPSAPIGCLGTETRCPQQNLISGIRVNMTRRHPALSVLDWKTRVDIGHGTTTDAIISIITYARMCQIRPRTYRKDVYFGRFLFTFK